MKKLVLSLLLATVMFGGTAVEVTASANAKTEHTTKHHAKKKTVKKHAKKSNKKHAKKIVKKRVAKKTTKKKARKVAKNSVTNKPKGYRNYKHAYIGEKRNGGVVVDAGVSGYVVKYITDPEHGLAGFNFYQAPWTIYHGHNRKDYDKYQLTLAKHEPRLKKELKKYGKREYLKIHAPAEEVTF